MFIAVTLLLIPKVKPLESPWTVNQINALRYVHTMESGTTRRVNELLIHPTWVKCHKMRKRSWMQRRRFWMIPFTYSANAAILTYGPTVSNIRGVLTCHSDHVWGRASRTLKMFLNPRVTTRLPLICKNKKIKKSLSCILIIHVYFYYVSAKIHLY